MNSSRGFDYAGPTIQQLLATNSPSTPPCASSILRSCTQTGTYATKYSNVFDLGSGEIFIDAYSGPDCEAKLSLAEELQKGEHDYDLPKITRQLAQAPKPWPSAASCLSLPDQEPEVTARIRAVVQDSIDGKLRAELFTPAFWAVLSSKRDSLATNLKSFGDLISMTLVERAEEADKRVYWYRLAFERAKLLQRFALDHQNRLADVEVEDLQQ